MSDTDSFLQEVSEELRRDRLYRNMRKYGWVAILLVTMIVGAATYREYLKSQTKKEAELFGTKIIEALNEKNAPDRISKLQKINAPSENAKAVVAMLLSAEVSQSRSPKTEITSLRDVLDNQSVDAHYHELLKFKILLSSADIMNSDERKSAYIELSEPGNPFRLLAQEQLALIEIEKGNVDSAIERISQILLDAELTTGLRSRATQMLIALGQAPELVNK